MSKAHRRFSFFPTRRFGVTVEQTAGGGFIAQTDIDKSDPLWMPADGEVRVASVDVSFGVGGEIKACVVRFDANLGGRCSFNVAVTAMSTTTLDDILKAACDKLMEGVIQAAIRASAANEVRA